MKKIIKISNLRNIHSLVFHMPEKGIWLLTAANGAGKTSLLACLRRIGQPNAFPLHFSSSKESDKLDNYEKASITYSIDEESVVYAYRGERWTPRPRRKSDLISKFGYQNVIYIGASADRITPSPDDFQPNKVRSADDRLVETLNKIFETEKFSNLKKIHLQRGGGNYAYLFKVDDKPAIYHSEKQFSTGELCVIKLIERIIVADKSSLILIDELELALHPRAQILLYQYLDQASKEKDLTVIFSTHSVSLLKFVNRNNIIYLDRDDSGVVNVVYECFPTYAIGNITMGKESSSDIQFYVEDVLAEHIVKALAKLAIHKKYNDKIGPDIKVIPIGGHEAVVSFLSRHKSIFNDRIAAYAVLDQDVQTETIPELKNKGAYNKLKLYTQDKVNFLPWTPEVGLVQFIKKNRKGIESSLKKSFSNNRLIIDATELNNLKKIEGKSLRSDSKRIYRRIVENLVTSTGESADKINRELCKIFALDEFNNNEKLKSLFLALVS